MRKTTKRALKIIGTAIFVFCVVFLIWFMSGEGVEKSENITWGVTFFPYQAEDLGMDWTKVYLALLDDMKVSNLRLAVPWSMIEENKGKYDFSSIEWMLQEAEKRDTKVILAVGRKLFRWPECHDPSWISELSEYEVNEATLRLVYDVVDHFKGYKSVVAWQVENEPGFPFGECHFASPSKDLFKKEVALVKSIDSTRPVLSTDSGELASWFGFSSYVDMLGVSLYRITENPTFGRFYYPMRPGFYQKKTHLAMSINKNLKKIFLSELQLEPWSTINLSQMTLEEQFDSMSFNRVASSIDYASHTGFDEIYLWGVEWWYWLREVHGDSRFWDLGKSLMNEK